MAAYYVTYMIGDIQPFSEEDYAQMQKKCSPSGVPIAMEIKYLKPEVPPGKCYDRARYMCACFEDSTYACGSIRSLAVRTDDPESASHAWMERDDWVYCPSVLTKYRKWVYYWLERPKDVYYHTYQEIEAEDARTEQIIGRFWWNREDFYPGGRARHTLLMSMPCLDGIARARENPDFLAELEEWKREISYDAAELHNEIFDKCFPGCRGGLVADCAEGYFDDCFDESKM